MGIRDPGPGLVTLSDSLSQLIPSCLNLKQEDWIKSMNLNLHHTLGSPGEHQQWAYRCPFRFNKSGVQPGHGLGKGSPGDVKDS